MKGRKKRRIFDIIQIGNIGDIPSQIFDITLIIMIVINLAATIFETFDSAQPFFPVLNAVETFTVICFTIEYILRVWTAEYLYPNLTRYHATISYITSGSGMMDLL